MIKFGKEWLYSGDVDTLEYGGKWYRDVSIPEENRHGLWQFIEITNMDEACGRDNEGRPTYVVEFSEVNLQTADVERAWESCGWNSEGPHEPCEMAEACHSYGCKAPLGSWEGNSAGKLLQQAKREASDLDPRNGSNIGRVLALKRPVNAIGSTAEEYSQGNIEPAIRRGLARGDAKAQLMAKLYGIRGLE